MVLSAHILFIQDKMMRDNPQFSELSLKGKHLLNHEIISLSYPFLSVWQVKLPPLFDESPAIIS